MSVFDSPLLLGFENMERMLEKVSRHSNDAYPPYNIEQTGQNTLRITLAVAGFGEDDLSVTIEDNQLVVRGQQNKDEDDSRVYLYRGIAARRFIRSFVLAEGIEVTAASTKNGLLHIDLEKTEPEVKVTKISINK